MSTLKVNTIQDTTGNDAISIGSDGSVGFVQTQMSHRNVIINGDMSVWQRGTSLSITSSYYRIADRWINYPADGSGTASRQEFTLGQTDVPGEPQYYLRHDQSTAASSPPNIQQRVENVRWGAGQSVTLSFYAKCSTGTVVIDPILRQYFGSGGSSQVDNTPSDITVTTTWQKFTRTITLGSISGKTIGSNSQLQIRLQLPSSTTFTLDIALVQLEVGSVATPFEHRSYGEELARCSRYTHVWVAEHVYGNYCTGWSNSATNGRGVYHLPVKMRVAPTLTTSGAFRVTDGAALTGATVSISRSSTKTIYLSSGGTSAVLTSGRANEMGANNDATATLIFDAEL